MEEELVMKGKDDQALLAKFDERLVRYSSYKKSRFGGSKQFTVAHFASDVTYSIDNFLQKNMDQVSNDVTQAVQTMDILGK